MMVDVRKRSVGVNFDKGRAEVAVWSPLARQMHICYGGKRLPLQKDEWGYWRSNNTDLQPGERYKFLIDEERELPDPASLSQPDGVHGHSRAMDIHPYDWQDHHWKNIPLSEYILYELHTGTFTAEGSFEAIEARLSHLQELGVNAIEIMPVAQFPGDRNWGYDGVYPFAVQDSYGGAEGLKHLVNACHRKGMAVVLDVVYNHLGPEGNYLEAYGPYLTGKYRTPWGGAINFDDAWCEGVRAYFIENALMWLRDFHIDALRLDAVHAIKDFGPKHILQEMRERVDELTAHTGRPHYLIVELDLNDTCYINRVADGGYGMDAQWVDEFHHALRVTALQEQSGYYADFNGIEHLAKAFKDAYVYDGQYSPHRKKNFGVKTSNQGQQFIVFSQNHDQVGNRMLGERSSYLTSLEMQKLMAAAVITSPYLPMLFMGEEWGEPAPFLYFVSHTEEELAEAVRKGRREEFAAFHYEGEAPDPVAAESFLRSKLQWNILNDEPHRTLLQYYKALLLLRKWQPALHIPNREQLRVEVDKDSKVLTLHRWTQQQRVCCLMNFSRQQQSVVLPTDMQHWVKLLDSAAPQWRGKQSAPETVAGGSPLTLQPEAVVIYADHIHPADLESKPNEPIQH